MENTEDDTWNHVTETKLSFTKDRNNMTITELRERMKRAKKRAWATIKDDPRIAEVIEKQRLEKVARYAWRILRQQPEHHGKSKYKEQQG